MATSTPPPAPHEDFYREVLDVLSAAAVDYLVGGAFGLRVHAGIVRDTKDFDLMLRPRDIPRALQACRAAGFPADYAYSHWIAKVHRGERFIDLIYRAGNGLCEVDEGWFRGAQEALVLGRNVRVCPAEEMIWQKAFVMERERFDGADIQHLLRAKANTLDWPRLLKRFGEDGRVLLAHLVLFGYVYPQQCDDIPGAVWDSLLGGLRPGSGALSKKTKVCRGTLLSREQYLPDLEWGYLDARNEERVHMSADEIVKWTNAIGRGKG